MKRYRIICMLAFILIVTSCYSPYDTRLPASHSEVYQGSEGIVTNFIVNAPPATVYEDHDFRVGVSVKNNGACGLGFLVPFLPGHNRGGYRGQSQVHSRNQRPGTAPVITNR